MIEAHLLCYNEREILPYALRHWTSFCDRIVVHDAFSDDGSRDIAKRFGAEIRDFVTDGVNDILAKQLKERCVMESKADWCAVVDADELIYFPHGWFHTLASYESNGVAVVRPHGWEMFSETFPTTQGQIYDEVINGARDQKWYGKAVFVAPQRIKSIVFGAGAHQTWATLKDGTKWDDVKETTEPEAYLLHCKHLGPIDRAIARYTRQQQRHSATNKKNKFGNFEAPSKHAADKRAAIMARLERVIR